MVPDLVHVADQRFFPDSITIDVDTVFVEETDLTLDESLFCIFTVVFVTGFVAWYVTKEGFVVRRFVYVPSPE